MATDRVGAPGPQLTSHAEGAEEPAKPDPKITRKVSYMDRLRPALERAGIKPFGT